MALTRPEPGWRMSLAGSELRSIQLGPGGEQAELLFSAAWVRPHPMPLGQGDLSAHLSGVRWVLSGVTLSGLGGANGLGEPIGRLRDGSELRTQSRCLADVPLPSQWPGPLSLTLVLPHGDVLEAQATGLSCLVDGDFDPMPSLAC
ncbi:MAG: hypothetical protein I8H88_10675 [Burkholderiales bacterium]|nr:hypothetical protein [Burkholderiales bacterium]